MDWVKWMKCPMDTQKDFALCFTVHGSTSFDPVTAVGGGCAGGHVDGNGARKGLVKVLRLD